MDRRWLIALLLVATLCSAWLQAQPKGGDVVPRTPWGDPDLQGDFTNSDESLIPMERPEALAGRALTEISAGELDALIDERNAARDEADRQRWELPSPLHWFENITPKNSRAWLVIDPDQAPFEYAGHEGNYAMRNLLAVARAEEAAARAR
jgi:hypothetical protein